MPLFQYFGWVGSLLLAALYAASWCCPAPAAPFPSADVPLNQRINIRIHTDHKWPERVVFDAARSSSQPETTADDGTKNEPVETLAQAEHRSLEAHAEMPAIPLRSRFRPSCSAGQVAEQDPLPIGKLEIARAHRRQCAGVLTSQLHRPPGKS
jgi:hypothetical protein